MGNYNNATGKVSCFCNVMRVAILCLVFLFEDLLGSLPLL